MGFPGVGWTKITNGEQLPPDLHQIVMILRNTGGDWEGKIKSLEELETLKRVCLLAQRTVTTSHPDEIADLVAEENMPTCKEMITTLLHLDGIY